MSVYEPAAPTDDDSWDAFVAGHPCGHVLQSSGWGRFRAARGWRMVRLALTDREGRIQAGAQLLLRRTLGGTVGYVPRGPVCLPGDEAWPPLLQAMRRAMGRRSVFLRVEPNWPDTEVNRYHLHSIGLVEGAAVQPPSTVVVDLALEEDAILARMKQKWRYNIRLAGRRGVSVRVGSASDLPLFESLLRETAERDGFPVRTSGYYAEAWRCLGPGTARLYVAELDGRTLAGAFIGRFGDTATYFYGASGNQGRRHMPNHLLQWEAMRRSRRAGCKRYDFWGIPDAVGRAVVSGTPADDVPEGSGGLWGVWGFKRGFGGQVHRSVGAWDDVRRALPYRIATHWLPELRSRIRRLR